MCTQNIHGQHTVNNDSIIHRNNFNIVFRYMPQSMYDAVKACIRYNLTHSNFLNSYIGLKQGDPTSPLLFMFFINDLIENINADLENIFNLDELRLFMILYTISG